jgi:hypothetical protein
VVALGQTILRSRKFGSLQCPTLALTQPVDAGRADGHHTIGVVALGALVPQLCGDRGTLAVDGVDDARPPCEYFVARESGDCVRIACGGVWQPDSLGDDQSVTARGAASVVLGDVGARDSARFGSTGLQSGSPLADGIPVRCRRYPRP